MGGKKYCDIFVICFIPKPLKPAVPAGPAGSGDPVGPASLADPNNNAGH